MTDHSTEFSRRLERLAKDNNITQAIIHRETGAAKSSISSWFNGRAEPHLKHIAPLAKILNTTTDELITGNKPPHPPQSPHGWTAMLVDILMQDYKERGDINKETFYKAISLLQEQ